LVDIIGEVHHPRQLGYPSIVVIKLEDDGANMAWLPGGLEGAVPKILAD